MDLRLYDAHNHLQDERFEPFRDDIWRVVERENVWRIVVNGSSEEDWEAVLALGRQSARVVPSYGYHPWHVRQRSVNWERRLLDLLEEMPSGVGEIGLDRWIKGHDLDDQVEVFNTQMRIASNRNLPASIHCLQAWGKLYELLRAGPCPACGFVLHSFCGPAEMIAPLAKLGAYFSLPGYFAHERKSRQREAFLHVPPDRLLIETDAPDQRMPESRERYPLAEVASGKALNHPGNLRAVYEFAAELFQESVEALTARVEANFQRLFGRISRS